MSIEKSEKLNVQLRGDAADKFIRIKAYLGLENDTEVIRSLISNYYNQHEAELTGPPKLMWHLNLSEKGVWIWDPEIHEAVYIYFKPEGIKCEHCKMKGCKHVTYALSKPEVQQIIKKKRREGWKIPE